MKEKLKRIPIVVRLLQLLHPAYSRCTICGLPWSNCESHTIQVTRGKGFFHVCQYCWERNDIHTLKQACIPVYNMWLEQYKKFNVKPDITLQQMYDAVEKDKLNN